MSIHDRCHLALTVLLPVAVSRDGLGVRLASDLALPAFLSFVNGAAGRALPPLPDGLHVVAGSIDPFRITASLE